MSAYWYIFLFAFAACYALSLMRRGVYGYSFKKASVLSLLLLPYAFICCKILFLIENPGADILEFAGLSFYGTVIFMPLLEIPTAYFAKVPYTELMDFIAPYGALCLAVCRIGCSLGGCCGAEPILVDGVYVIPPIQLIESGLDFMLCSFILWRERAGRIIVRGEQTCIFVITYSFIRLIMEAYRRTPKNIYGMSNGQWLSIASALIAFILLVYLQKRVAVKEKSKSIEE